MNIYFAVSDEMIKEQNIPEMLKDSEIPWLGNYKWELTHNTILNYIISDSTGKILDQIKKYQKTSFCICKAFIQDSDIIEALLAAVVGDVMIAQVFISEITWIK